MQIKLLAAALLFMSSPALSNPNLLGSWTTGFFPDVSHEVKMSMKFSQSGTILENTFIIEMLTAAPVQGYAKKTTRRGEVINLRETETGIYEIDIKISDIAITLLDPASARHFTKQSMCNIREWKINESVSVAGQTCDKNELAKAGELERFVLELKEGKLRISPFWGEGAVVPAPESAAVRSEILSKHFFRKI